MSIPMVSVVMSVFNGERFLKKAVDSVLTQSLQDLQFIIVDDGSTDTTRDIVHGYSDPRVEYVYQENAGLTRGLNRGFALAAGEYVARMDADDVSLSGRFDSQIAFLKCHPDVGLLGTQAYGIDAKGETLGYEALPVDADQVEKELRRRGNCIVHGSVILRRSVFDAVGGYCDGFRFAQDYDLALRIADRYRVCNLPEFHYCLRIRLDSITCRHYAEQTQFAALARALASKRSRGLPASLEDEKRGVFEGRGRGNEERRGEGIVSSLLCAYGTTNLNNDEPKLARVVLRKSLELNMYNTRAAALYLLSYFPRNVRKHCRRAYQLLRHGSIVTPELRS